MKGLKRHDDRDEPTAMQKAVMVASALFTLLLLGYLAWQAATAPPAAEPTAEVTSVEPSGDGVRVGIALLTDGRGGYREVEVEVDCGEEPVPVTFTNVPARGRRVAHVLCPAGTTDPPVEVVWWTPA